MKKLYEVAQLIRSKNAGPFIITIDVIFPDRDTLDKVLATGVLDADKVAKLCGVEEEKLKRYYLPLANAVKFSYPRKAPLGDFLDVDLYGCQMHRPVVLLDVPID